MKTVYGLLLFISLLSLPQISQASEKGETLTINLNDSSNMVSNKVLWLIRVNKSAIEQTTMLRNKEGGQTYCLTFKPNTETDLEMLESDMDDIQSDDLSFERLPCSASSSRQG